MRIRKRPYRKAWREPGLQNHDAVRLILQFYISLILKTNALVMVVIMGPPMAVCAAFWCKLRNKFFDLSAEFF